MGHGARGAWRQHPAGGLPPGSLGESLDESSPRACRKGRAAQAEGEIEAEVASVAIPPRRTQAHVHGQDGAERGSSVPMQWKNVGSKIVARSKLDSLTMHAYKTSGVGQSSP